MKPLQRIRKFFAPITGATGTWWNSWTTPGEDRNWLRRYQGYVYACVSAIAEDVAMIEFKVYQNLKDGTLKEVQNHSLLRVLDNPNPLMSKYQLIEMTQTHIELAGEAFWYSEIGEETKKPKSFYLLPPDRMTVAVDTESPLPRIAGYVFTKENGTKVPLEPEEITHFKLPNPWDPYRGYGTVEAALLYIQTEKYGSEFTRNYIFNNAMPAGIVSVKGAIDANAFEEVKQQWKQEYGTIAKAGKTAFIKDLDIEFTKVGTTLGEAALKEIKDMSRDDIMTMFRVSKPILGIFEDVNLASAKTAQYVFMSRVVDPKMSRLVDTLQFVLDRWNKKPLLSYTLGYESPVPEDVDDKIKLYEAGRNNWMTTNEIRKDEGLDPVDGGDVLYQPLNLVPIGAPPTANKSKSKGMIVRRTIKKTVKNTNGTEIAKKESFRTELIGNQKQWEKRFQLEADKLMDEQEAEIMSNLKVTKSKKKAWEEYLFDHEKWDGEFVKRLTPIEYELLKEQGALALALAGEDELEFQLNEAVRKDTDQRIARMSHNYNDNTIKLLQKEFVEAASNGESLDDIKKRINKVFASSKDSRTEVIARTETLHASNAGAKEGYLQTGYVTKIEWYANPGACEFCRPYNGKVISMTENFANLGETITGDEGGTYNLGYDNVPYPPLHPNCTCTIIPVRE